MVVSLAWSCVFVVFFSGSEQGSAAVCLMLRHSGLARNVFRIVIWLPRSSLELEHSYLNNLDISVVFLSDVFTSQLTKS